MSNPLQNPRSLRLFVAVAAVLIALIWVLADQYLDRLKSYAGTVVEKYSSTSWSRNSRHRGSRRNHHLVIQTDDGRKLDIRVGNGLYGVVRKGDRVVKVRGEQSPRREEAADRTATPDGVFNPLPASTP